MEVAMWTTPSSVLLLLFLCHFLADYPLQGPFLSTAKNRHTAVDGFPWQQAMFAHVFIHGALVALVTGLWWLGLAEAWIHWITDEDKCEGHLTVNEDQAVHLVCKALWFGLWWMFTRTPLT
jgi:hypothetical protein